MLEKMKKERKRLEGELEKGKQMLIEMRQKVNNLVANMQRIQGALQFIDSQVAEAEKPETKDEPE